MEDGRAALGRLPRAKEEPLTVLREILRRPRDVRDEVEVGERGADVEEPLRLDGVSAGEAVERPERSLLI